MPNTRKLGFKENHDDMQVSAVKCLVHDSATIILAGTHPIYPPQELVVELKPGLAKGAGHSSRIFSVKFHPDDPNVIVSGGWVSCSTPQISSFDAVIRMQESTHKVP